uniref:Uncharacterized protein n=1 Tax=Moniliophthora roreri TaxID=221103 RepID=A0A0W0F7Z2_MONRR
MSLDDPNVLAGLANDGQPFFSDVMDALEVGDVTPMPKLFDNPQGHVNHLQAGSGSGQGQHQQVGGGVSGYGLHSTQRPSTSSGSAIGGAGGVVLPPAAQTPGSREQETKELREFWKQYMRTPLTGGGGGGGGGGNGDINMLSPGPSYRRQRVTSLPSAKTPTATMDDHSRAGYILPVVNGYGYTKSQSNPNTAVQQGQGQVAGVGGAGAAAVGNADDLKSYEAAVLARKAPTNLNLVPRVRKKAAAPQQQQQGQQGQGQQVQVSFAPDTREGGGGGSTSPSKRRPSFKRLASQTLESDNHKRYRDDSSTTSDAEDGDDEDDGEEGTGTGSSSPPNLQLESSVSPPILHAIGRKSDPHNHSTFHHQQFVNGTGGMFSPGHEFALLSSSSDVGAQGGGGGGEKKRRTSGGGDTHGHAHGHGMNGLPNGGGSVGLLGAYAAPM